MRVIGGEFRSRVLKSVPGMDTRPTPDRLRESLFSILAPRIEGVTFADLYAGTGAVGIEAISRAAAKAIFVESDRSALHAIRDNLKSLGIEGRAEVRQARASQMIARLRADVVFLDPPYKLEAEYRTCLDLLGANAPELVIVQHSPRLKLEETYGGLHRVRELKQGDNMLSFYEPRMSD
ncbi:MAG: 16S rRNA (guanine(966)-N(2))-methyltransferase RsmD [Bryobacteraceae bacterium]